MNDQMQTLRDDLAFLRDLTEDAGSGFGREAVVMIGVGVIFGVIDFVYWLIFSGRLATPPWVGAWLWAFGLVLFFVTLPFVRARLPAPTGTAARATAAAWGGIGMSLLAAGLGLLLGAWRTGLPNLVLWVFPTVLFTLYGAAWVVAFAAKRKAWFAGVALACFVEAVAVGALMGSPDQFLALSLGLFALLAAPGFAVLRAARAA
jgi:hypothetical protein